MDQQKIQELDSGIYQTAQKFQVLKHLNWPAEEEHIFLRNWHRNKLKLPTFKPHIPDFSENIKTLQSLMNRCDVNEPIEKFLHDTAESYVFAGRMLQSVGTKAFTRFSSMIYGRPDDVYKNQDINALDSAQFFLEITDNLLDCTLVPPTQFNISSQKFLEQMLPEVNHFFQDDPVELVLDETISAKTLAGSTKIKINELASFSTLDKNQLLNHEAFIHSATMINGKKQDNLKCLSLGAPRTTRTQEGLAVFSEVATLSMDIVRMRRIALRVPAIQMAIEGADFIEIFKYFLDSGQTDVEAVRSTQRVFRGGDMKGGVVFTKDGVYLKGLFEVHAFMKLAINKNHPAYIQNLFTGRLTMADVVRMEEYFENGWIKPPTYVPDWACDFRRLAVLLAFSSFVSKIQMEKVTFERFVEFEEELKIRH